MKHPPSPSLHTYTCTLLNSFDIAMSLHAVFPPSPGPLMAIFNESSFIVSWSPPSSPVEGGVGGYVFGVTGEGCGCVSMNVSGDTTSVTCSGWTAAGQTCSFEVRTLSQDCGFTSNSTSITIKLSGLSTEFPKQTLVMCTMTFSSFQSTISQRLASRTYIQS